MSNFQSFTEVHVYLNGLMSETKSRRHAYTLERMLLLMEYLGNPQNSYKTIHVAGTSGKTSTSYYLSALLGAAGARVGLSVSPHIDEINERVQINNKLLSEKRFCSSFSKFVSVVEKSGIKPTYFEMVVAFAFWEFARQKVDYAVVEVGLGGLLDGTNVMSRADKICVITDIGYDHTSTLGKSLEAIAAQKAGIIKPHNPVFAYDQDEDVMAVVREVSSQQQADFHEVWPLKSGELPTNLPLFQRRNWYLAVKVFEHVAKRDDLPALTEEDMSYTTLVRIPARMEVIKYKDKTIILDGAHNPQKLTALAKSVKHAYPKQEVACLVSFIRTKQLKVNENLRAILPLCSHMIVTEFVIKDTEKFSTNALKIVEKAEELGFEGWEMIADPAKAFSALLKRKEPVLLVTGSFFFLHDLRAQMQE